LTGLLRKEKQFIVDIASGQCSLVKYILENTDLKVVATDFSMKVIESTYECLRKEGYDERVMFIALDARKTPFRTDSISLMTSYLGLQNIDKPGNVLSELRRISSKVFYSISSFCSKDDEANRASLRKSGTEFMRLEESHKQKFIENNWHVEILNSIFAMSRPTPMGKIIEGVGIDGFPVAEGYFKHCIVKASKWGNISEY